MALLISDANIFIDFEDGGLLEALFRLPEAVGGPDLLFEDELRAQHEHLLRPRAGAGGALRGDARSRRGACGQVQPTKPARPRRDGCCGAGSLPWAEGVEVHGTLWVAERLVDTRVITVDQLRDAYAKMKASDRRLPWAEVDRQLARLAGTN